MVYRSHDNSQKEYFNCSLFKLNILGNLIKISYLYLDLGLVSPSDQIIDITVIGSLLTQPYIVYFNNLTLISVFRYIIM